jgi:hypothetical protein
MIWKGLRTAMTRRVTRPYGASASGQRPARPSRCDGGNRPRSPARLRRLRHPRALSRDRGVGASHSEPRFDQTRYPDDLGRDCDRMTRRVTRPYGASASGQRPARPSRCDGGNRPRSPARLRRPVRVFEVRRHPAGAVPRSGRRGESLEAAFRSDTISRWSGRDCEPRCTPGDSPLRGVCIRTTAGETFEVRRRE